MFFKKNAPVLCPFPVLFEILNEDMNLGICCDILFSWQQKKHSFGVYGDDGETRKNLRFYLDKNEYLTLEDLRDQAKLNGIPLGQFQEEVLVHECDGCYPRSTPLLEKYYSENS